LSGVILDSRIFTKIGRAEYIRHIKFNSDDIMKVYTKTGDQGTTGILGSKRLKKHDLRIDAYGNVDELNAHIGLLNTTIGTDLHKWIQDRLFIAGSWLATEPGMEDKINIPKIETQDIELLEKWMDEMEAQMEPIQHFILPGGSWEAAQAHVIRCVCRRAERSVWALHEVEAVQQEIPQFLNRLSDYYFVLSRWVLKQQGKSPVFWIPEKK
jgi:cob(I)alamin adenosyltransferase